MKIDPTAVTTRDPAPALGALGYTPHATAHSMWVHPDRPQISVWPARGGDYLWRDHAAGRTGNIIHLVRDIYPSLSFPAALIRARDLLVTNIAPSAAATTMAPASSSAPTPASILAISLAPSLLLKESSAAPAATEYAKKEPFQFDEIEQRYISGAQLWTAGLSIPSPLTDRHITHVAGKFQDTFCVTGEESVRIPGYGVSDDGQIGMLGYDTYRANGRSYALKGSRSGISMTAGLDRATHIVIVSSLIDAMANDLIHPADPRRGYIAVRTGTEKIAVRLIRGLLRSGSPAEEIIISTANDSNGLLIASKITGGLTAGADPITGIRAHYVPPIGAERTNADALRRVMSATSRLAAQIRDQIAARSDHADHHPAEFITDIAAE